MNKDFDAGPRVRTNNFFDIGVVGRRTGIAMKANIKKDADGLDNIDDFWEDENNDSAADSDQSHDAEQDDLSGEDEEEEVHPSPSVRKSDPRRYLEQEAPEELLLTPTSRRSRGGSKGSHLYAGAEGSPSPSLDRIRKRLVFTKDSSDNETEQTPSVRGQINKPISVSPALDKILSDSQERKAKMAMNAGRDSARPTKGTSAGSSSSSGVANNKGPAKAVPRKEMAKQTTAQPSKAPVPNRRPVDVPKAFDLGGDFDGQDDLELPEYNINSSLDDARDFSGADRQETPPPATSARPKAARTPSEFKRKSRVAPEQPALSDDEGPVHDEPETRSEDDNRMRFSDEDEPSRKEDDEESEEDEPLQDNRRRLAGTSQKKRGASTKEPVSVSKEGKRAARATKSTVKKTNIPKATSSTNARQQQRWSDEDKDEEELSSSEDYREVPSAMRSKGTSKESSGMSRAGPSRGTTKGMGRITRHQEVTTTQEIPIVPEQNADDSGVRRSHRTKVAPLEFWKNEKLVFDKTNDGLVIKSVIRAAPEKKAAKPLNSESNKRKRQPRSETKPPPARRQRTVREEDAQEDRREYESENYSQDSMDEDQELKTKGLSEDAKVTADVLVFGSDNVVLKDIAESNKSLQFRNVQSGEYQLHRGLEDAYSVVTGTMKIKPEGRKPVNKGTNTSMVFYVIKGLVQVKVHESQFVVSTGGRFLVPRGNTYSIVNISNKESTLFFVQTKQPPLNSTETIATSSATTSTSAASNTKEGIKRKSQIGGYMTVQPGGDLFDRNSSPSPLEEATTAADDSRSPSPAPATNKRRSTSVRRSSSIKYAEPAATSPSPSPPPSTSIEATAKNNGGAAAGVSRQPSVLASMFR